MNWVLLKNSFVVSALAGLLGVIFGLTAAVCAACAPRVVRVGVFIAAIITLALPPFLITNSWLHFLGPTGIWRGVFGVNVASMAGAAWILGLMLWPITMFLVIGAWKRLEAAQLEADLAVAGLPLFRKVMLPLARGALAEAGLLTFVLAFNNFSVPAILQVKTFPAEVWIRFSTNFDTAGAVLLSVPMVLVAFVVLAVLRYRGVSWPHVSGAVEPGLLRSQMGKVLLLISSSASILICVLSAGLPVLQLLTVARTWSELPGALAAGQNAIFNSFSLPLASAAVVMFVSVCAGLLLRRSGGSPLFAWLDAVFWLPFFVPGVFLGIVLIAALNHDAFQILYQSAGIVILALCIRYFAFGWNISQQALRSTDTQLTDAATLEGAGFWRILRHAYWPQIAPQVAAGFYVVFLLALWDVESILLILPARVGETLAVRIFNLLHYGHNAQVNALCLTMLGLALLPIVIWAVYCGLSILRESARSRRLAVMGILFPCLMSMTAAGLLSGCSPSASSPTLNSTLFSDIKIIGSRGVGVGQLNKPRSVAVDNQDNLYVVDMTGRVQKFSSNGVFLLSWQMPQTDLGKPKGMCRDRQGNIIVVEPHYSRINEFSSEGKLLAQWGNRGTNDGQLSVPRAIGINSSNEAFVTEYLERERVQRFSLTDVSLDSGPKWLLSFGKPGTGPGEFNRPEGLCVDSHDLVYVADSCNHRIQVFSPDGKLLRTYGKPGKGTGELSYPYDICVDNDGRQYVCEFGNSRIQVFDSHDQPIEIIGGRGAEPGQFSNPWGVALDSKGNLYVADSQNHRVQKLIRRNGANARGSIANMRQGSSAGLRPAVSQTSSLRDFRTGTLECVNKKLAAGALKMSVLTPVEAPVELTIRLVGSLSGLSECSRPEACDTAAQRAALRQGAALQVRAALGHEAALIGS